MQHCFRILCVLALSACGPASTPVAQTPEPGGMWSGTLTTDRPHDAPARVAAGQRAGWPATLAELPDEERSRCKEAAWSALLSPEIWSHYFESPESAADLELSESGIQYYCYRRDTGLVDVAIPSGASVGWHPTYIGVTLDRVSLEVLDIYSSFWP